MEVGGWKATTGDEANSWRQAQEPGWAPAKKWKIQNDTIPNLPQATNLIEVQIIFVLTCSGSEDPEPRSPEVAEPPLPGEDEERELP